MRRFVAFLLLLVISCSSISVRPSDLRTDPIADHRRRAAVLIGTDRQTKHLPSLLEALRSDEVPIVRAQSAVAVGQLGVRSEKVYNTLKESLRNDPSPIVQRDVIFALKELDYKKASPILVEKLTSASSPTVRADAASVLEELGDETVYSDLVNGLDDESYMVRHACLDTLRNMTGLENGPLKSEWWKQKIRRG